MKRAFTLVELIIYMGIFSIMIVALTQVFEATLNVYSESTSSSSISREGAFLLARFNYDIRSSSNVLLPATSGQEGSILELTIDGQSSTYQVSNGRLTLTRSGVTNFLTGNDVSVSVFNVLRTGSGVQLSWTLNSLNRSQSFITTISPR